MPVMSTKERLLWALFALLSILLAIRAHDGVKGVHRVHKSYSDEVWEGGRVLGVFDEK